MKGHGWRRGGRGWGLGGGGEKKEGEGGYDKDVSERERLGGGGRENQNFISACYFILPVYSHFW